MSPEYKPLFPEYLLPALSFPFRRRKMSTTAETHEHAVPYLSSSPTSSPDSSPSSSPPSYSHSHITSLLHAALHTKNHASRPPRLGAILPTTLQCLTCVSDIAFASQIVSKGFTGRHGRAYLIGGRGSEGLVNTRVGRAVSRELLTGTHVVADVSCVVCGAVLGWKYVDAREEGQMYKIGKFILETKRVVRGVCWEDGDVTTEREGGGDTGDGEDDGKVVVFDSEDDEECEDLFAGVWDAGVVKKRRARRLKFEEEGRV